MKVLKESEIEKLNDKEKLKYYYELKEYCLSIKTNYDITKGQKLIAKLCPSLRNYELIIKGENNLPYNGGIIVCNHSNSHDTFTACEVFTNLNLPVSVFAASDDLNFLSNNIFKVMDCTLIDRNNKKSCQDGLFELTSKALNYDYGLIFGEATWNLHPYRPMQRLKIGAARAAAISEKYIIPTNFEYIERKELCQKEKDLYEKCIVTFDKPIKINPCIDLSSQILLVEKALAKMRLSKWEENGLFNGNIKLINPNIYVNHTWLKKFGALGFIYDSESEFKYLYFDKNTPKENEYHLKDSLFLPGITKKEDKEKVLQLIKKENSEFN